MDSPLVNPTVNQVNPTGSLNALAMSKVLRVSNRFVLCPNCKEFAATRTDRSCSCGNICCYLFVCCWWIFQIYREKDISCYNATHYCSKCNYKLYEYRAC